jgi:hypothetical protein
MKRWFLILATLSLCLRAQEKPSAPKQEAEIQSPLAPKQTVVSSNTIILPKEPPVKLSGLATDIKHSTNRWKMFSLRKPVDPKTDGANVIRTTRTEAGGPIKLFSIDF